MIFTMALVDSPLICSKLNYSSPKPGAMKLTSEYAKVNFKRFRIFEIIITGSEDS